MKLVQIADILNDKLVPNLLGEATTIAPDLSNIVELGTAIEDLTGDEFLNFAKTFAVGVARTEFETRIYKSSFYGLMNDAREYGGVIQRARAKSFIDAVDSHIWTLEDGTDYFDGKYHGTEFDIKIYSMDDAFKVVHSIPNEEFKQYFTSADGVSQLVAIIETNVRNSVEVKLEALAKSTLQQLIATSSDNTIHMVTTYNTLFEPDTELTTATCLHDASFLRWYVEQVLRLRDMIKDVNKKYNDGTVPTFTPAEDIRVAMLTEVDKAIVCSMLADTFHKDLLDIGEYNTVNFWQNASNQLLPTLGVTAEVKYQGENDESATTISNVGTVIFDRYSAGMCARLDKITTQYIGSEDFTNYYHHIANSRFVDTRNASIVLTLD